MTDAANFYQLLDISIKQGLNDEMLEVLIQNCNQNQAVGPLFDLPVNVQYALRRFINACMSTDPQIRENSFQALQKLVASFELKPNQQKLIRFILEASNYKKAVNRKSQAEAFAVGRIIVIKALRNSIKNYSNIFQSLVQIMKDYPQLQQQAIQLCHLISNDKVLKLKFQNLSPQSKCARFLYKILLRIKDPKSQRINIQQFKQILQIQTNNYPKKSIALYNFGKYIHTILDVPNQFFSQYANKFLDNQSQKQVDIHEIYSLMTILRGFLDHTVISHENYKTHFDKRIIAVWLQQFRVLNKKMKGLAKHIKITFQENNPQFSYQVLVDIHQEGIYIDNISINHPLGRLYEWVDVNKYWQYLYNLCTIKSLNVIKQEKDQKKKTKKSKQKQNKKKSKQDKQMQVQQQQEEQSKTYFNQLQFLIKLRFKQLADEHICKTIILLLNNYQQRQKNKQVLYLCINLFNMICRIAKKKKKQQTMKLNKKMMLIINKIQLAQLKLLKQDEQKVKQFKKCIVWVKKNTINIRKQQGYSASDAQINFFNFYNSMLFYCLIYPDQLQTCVQLQLVYQDLMTIYKAKAQQPVIQSKPTKKQKKQKKVKLQQQEKQQKNKPIHVLNDIFISLMTKPPVFLRKAIHNLYENIIPFLDENDIGNMLSVITTPDAEFIEEI